MSIKNSIFVIDMGMDLFRRINVLLILWASVLIAGAGDSIPDNQADRYIRDDRIISNKEYVYWDKGGRIGIDVTMLADSSRIFESLMRLETADGLSYNLVMSVDGCDRVGFLWIHGSDAELFSPGMIVARDDTLSMMLSFQGRGAVLQVCDTVFQLPAQDLRSDQGYRIRGLEGSHGPVGMIGIRGWRHVGDTDIEDNVSAWFWIIIVILVDAVVFIVVHYRRKRQRLMHEREQQSSEALVDRNSTVRFPQRNAIYLFGDMRILDNDGQEVSCRFSPLLRELFLILLFKTPEGGISSKTLTEMLWLDKDESSAKNNRSVNLHKLRTLLAGVGNCSIERKGGKWQILFDDNTYIDYYECIGDRLQPDRLNADTVSILSAMTARGGLLPSSDYLWLDPYKSSVSDNLIGTLLRYAAGLGDNDGYGTRLQVCDIVSRFDPVNEFALKLRCLTYLSMNRQYMARRAYDQFVRVYREMYGEDFSQSYSSIISRS